MEKAKITREQAEAIEKIKDIDYAINIHSFKKRPDSPLVDMSTARLARALFVGYEVEPEFKVGDWVAYKDGSNFNSFHQGKFEQITSLDGRDVYYNSNCCVTSIDKIRHATPEEIKQEKERRWWAKIGRKPKEYQLGDLAKIYGSAEVREVNYVGEDESVGFAELMPLYKPEEVKLVCPVENRLDVKTND